MTKTQGYCEVSLTLDGRDYRNIRLSILPGLCVDVILGQDFQQQHASVTLNCGEATSYSAVWLNYFVC